MGTPPLSIVEPQKQGSSTTGPVRVDSRGEVSNRPIGPWDWKEGAQRWQLVTAIVILIGGGLAGGGFLLGVVSAYRTREQQRVDAALADRASIQLGQRVATIEAENRGMREEFGILRDAIKTLSEEMKTQNRAVIELSAQIKILNARLEMQNGQRVTGR